ncbi:hypothetical protein FISHEDRAFT_69326 [Fistulina hepatica ATCC 64428]|uniref:Uncharacterized protein n=1 Tax=Fistulina hepatica ATCC 64428 TaxID=1128425 RepID=A0A0D7APZ4_9AGAR|nr:hypothetical protein FISHEDRAFT_69326 [Fistulina hepatica ATCC 64428]
MPPDLSPEEILDALEVTHEDVSDVMSEAKARDRVDRYLRTMMSPIWAVDHLHRVVLRQPHSVIRVYIAKVPANEKPMQITDIADLVGRLKRDNAPQTAMIVKWLEEHKPAGHANQHVEAVLMGLLYQQPSTLAMFASNEKLPIAVGGRCCFCCYKLGQLLEKGRLNNDDDLRTDMPALILPGTLARTVLYMVGRPHLVFAGNPLLVFAVPLRLLRSSPQAHLLIDLVHLADESTPDQNLRGRFGGTLPGDGKVDLDLKKSREISPSLVQLDFIDSSASQLPPHLGNRNFHSFAVSLLIDSHLVHPLFSA